MTVPFLSNCAHKTDSWCLDCTSELGHKLWAEMDKVSKLDKALVKFQRKFCTYEKRKYSDANVIRPMVDELMSVMTAPQRT